MSKKSFTDGLESLFSAREKESLDTLAPPKRKHGARTVGESDTDASGEKPTRKSTHKTFSLDLDAFLAEVLQDSLMEEIAQADVRSDIPPDDTPHGEGVDALIRSTLDTGTMEVTPGSTRRVTFFFEPDKVEQLKAIARSENIYLREMVRRIVAEYLERYRTN